LINTRVEGERSAVIPCAHLGAVFPVNAITWVLPDVILKVRLPALAVRGEDPELTAVFDRSGQVLDRRGVRRVRRSFSTQTND
jgi:hypothetical protein